MTSGYLPLGGIMITKAIKDAMDSVKPEDRWMHAYTPGPSGVLRGGDQEHRDHGARAALGERGQDADPAPPGTPAGLRRSPMPATSGAARGSWRRSSLEDRATKKNFAGDKKVAPRIQAEMMKRGVVTRTPGGRPPSGARRLVYFAPPLVVTETEVDRLVKRRARRRQGRARRLS